MNEFARRVVLAYVVGSGLIWFMDDSMIYNGAAYRGNPAWWLISSIYGVFSWSWMILLSLAMATTIIFILIKIREIYHSARDARLDYKNREESKTIVPFPAVAFESNWHASQTRSNSEERFRREQQELERKTKEEAAAKLKQEQIEAEKRRTPEEAVDLALDGFC